MNSLNIEKLFTENKGTSNKLYQLSYSEYDLNYSEEISGIRSPFLVWIKVTDVKTRNTNTYIISNESDSIQSLNTINSFKKLFKKEMGLSLLKGGTGYKGIPVWANKL